MKRSIWFILILFLSSYIMQSALPEKGLLGLINGVDVKNHITLLSSDFFFAALIVFSNFGQTEGFLFGIGKYQLMRYKNRNSLLRKIILKSFIIVGIMCLLRIIIYMLVLMLRNKYVFDLQISDIMIYILFSILSFFILSLIQIYSELCMGSFAAVLICMIYYIITVVTSGIMLENDKEFISMLIITNYPMKNRTEIMHEEGLSFYTMFFVMVAPILLLGTICKRAINKKDIF